jgi:hypothetical protein
MPGTVLCPHRGIFGREASPAIPRFPATAPNLRSDHGPSRLRRNAVPCDPVDGLGVGLLRVGLEHQALARAPATGVDQRVEALGEFVLVVMRVAVGAQVEVALRAAQRAEESAQVFGVRGAIAKFW